MDTKRNIKINIEGASLTEAEKKEILDIIEAKLNGHETTFNPFDIPEQTEKKEHFKRVKNGASNMKRNIGNKINSMSPQELLAWAGGISILTKTGLNVWQEIRLTRKEHRLQKEAKRQAQRRRDY